MMYILFLIPILILVIGFLMFKHFPKKINIFIGYRTKQSMKNDDTWKFANQYCGKLFIILSLILIIINFVLFILISYKVFILTENLMAIIILLQVVLLVFIGLIVNYRVVNKFRN